MTVPRRFIPPFRELVEGVDAYFVANGITAVVERGWKARQKLTNQGPGRGNRVVFLPSKQDGSAGRLVNPRQAGLTEEGEDLTTDPPTPVQFTWRPLVDWQRLLLVSVWAYDGDKRNDEGAQDDAVYWLFTQTVRAVNAAAFGNAVWGAIAFTPPDERALGLEVLAELSFQFAMPDVPLDLTWPAPIVTRQT